MTGASSGIGEAGARKLAAEGATVIVVARRGRTCSTRVVDRTSHAAGGDATAIACDLSDLDAVDALVADVESGSAASTC